MRLHKEIARLAKHSWVQKVAPFNNEYLFRFFHLYFVIFFHTKKSFQINTCHVYTFSNKLIGKARIRSRIKAKICLLKK